MPKKSGHQIALTVLASIILTVILVSLVNVGLSLFLEQPEYNDFCGDYRTSPIIKEGEPIACTEDAKICPDGTAVSRDPTRNCEFPPCSNEFETCQREYEEALKPYNQIRYYIFAGIGFILLLVGLFSSLPMLQYTGLATGGILLTEGIVTNFENKIMVFVSLLIILIIFGILSWRIVKKFE